THLVARAQLAAPDLGRRDVDVALALAQPAQPQKAIPLRHPVKDAGDLLRLDLWLRLLLGLRLVSLLDVRLLLGLRLVSLLGLRLLLAVRLVVPFGLRGLARLGFALRSSGGLLDPRPLLRPRPLAALLDRLDQLVAGHHPVTRQIELACQSVKLREVFVPEGHQRAHASRSDPRGAS